ncbi:MAG TPA: class 1 fructose-bisphosphatase, partial [Hyphomicrobiales bacterium]
MRDRPTLRTHLSAWSLAEPGRFSAAAIVEAIAETTAAIAARIARGPLDGALAAKVGGNADGDTQTTLDV